MIAEGNLTARGRGCIVLRMGKTVENDQVIRDVLAELEAMPPEKRLSAEEWRALAKKLPRLGDMPEGWTSADDIREFRGPLPEDDPLYQRNILGRR